MSIGFIFTNYNNTDYSKALFASLKKSDAGSEPIIFVDNDSVQSEKDKLSELASQSPNIDALFMDANLGYFRGLNEGIKYARKKYPEIECWYIGNNDLIFPRNVKENSCKFLKEHINYPVISPNIITQDGEHQNPHVINKISNFREFVYDLYHTNYYLALLIKKVANVTRSFTDRKDELQHEIAQEIYQGYGACYILTPKFFELFEVLDAPTFLMYEEFFLSAQLASKNYRVFYEPGIKVEHVGHASTGQLPKRKYWEFSRDSHREYRKHVKFWR